MNIQDAIKEADKQGKGIAREEWGLRPESIFPTNTIQCCILVSFKGDSIKPRWNPSKDDLVADDWIVY